MRKPISQKTFNERLAKLQRKLEKEQRLMERYEDGEESFDRDDVQYTEGIADGLAQAIRIMTGKKLN